MKKPMIKIVDVLTGIEIDREMTGEELDQLNLDQAQAKADILKTEAEAEAKANARKALLTKLGITAEEAKLLLS